MKIILILIILVTACVSVVSSWVGVLAYYTLALWGPQYIWFWLFADLRVSFVVAVFTFLGVGVGFFKTGYEFRFLFTRINFWVLILYVSILVSYLFGPYIDNPLNKQFDPDTFIFDATKIFLFYFIATLAINDIEKLKYFTLLFVAVIVYYCYWANKQYFTDNWSQFAVGRLMGPFGLDMGSIYRDENSFAMLFVSGLPFLYSFSLKTGKMIRFTCWAVILLGWHAIFLTGSRGGVVGLSVIIFAIIFWIPTDKRMFWIRILIIPFFLFIYSWQAGSLMKERSGSIVEFQGESSAEGRLIAWGAGYQMLKDYPITGVGLCSFATAFPDYNDQITARVAHNTFVEFTAENGFFAGLAYYMIIFLFFSQSRGIYLWWKANPNHPHRELIEFCNNSSKVSFLGLSVCALFLSLNYYEIYFYLLVINNALFTICAKEHNARQLQNRNQLSDPQGTAI